MRGFPRPAVHLWCWIVAAHLVKLSPAAQMKSSLDWRHNRCFPFRGLVKNPIFLSQKNKRNSEESGLILRTLKMGIYRSHQVISFLQECIGLFLTTKFCPSLVIAWLEGQHPLETIFAMQITCTNYRTLDCGNGNLLKLECPAHDSCIYAADK